MKLFRGVSIDRGIRLLSIENYSISLLLLIIIAIKRGNIPVPKTLKSVIVYKKNT